MTEKELCCFYESKNPNEVFKAAKEMFKNWTKQDNDKLFKVDSTKPWLDET